MKGPEWSDVPEGLVARMEAPTYSKQGEMIVHFVRTRDVVREKVCAV